MIALKVLFWLLLGAVYAQAHRFLLCFTVVSPSLSYIGAAYAHALVDAGHEVVFVTPHPLKDPPKVRFRQIDVSSIAPTVTANLIFNMTEMLSPSNLQNNVVAIQQYGLWESVLTLQHPSVLKLLDDETQKFDAVLADLLESELLAGLAVAFNCPMMWSYSVGVDSNSLKLIDTIASPAYIPDYLSHRLPSLTPFTFWERIEELYNFLEALYVERIYLKPKEEEVYKAVIGPVVARQGRALPDYEDVVYNASFIFGNVHLAAEHLPALPRNHASIGGIHIREPVKPLPKNLQDILDNSSHGVIYFSFGTNWKSSTMPPALIQQLLDTFGKFKQTVIWKFEVDLPNKPSNVHTVQFAPQQSILAHPNLVLFITHGGLLSATEAVHFGVPLITVPLCFDQYKNANKAVKGGYGLRVDYSADMADGLEEAIKTLVGDPRFKQRAGEVSLMYHARPLPPAQEFVHWAQLVVRSGGARYLRSPALRVPWYQRLYLDVLALFIVAIALSVAVLNRIARRLWVSVAFVIGSKKYN